MRGKAVVYIRQPKEARSKRNLFSKQKTINHYYCRCNNTSHRPLTLAKAVRGWLFDGCACELDSFEVAAGWNNVWSRIMPYFRLNTQKKEVRTVPVPSHANVIITEHRTIPCAHKKYNSLPRTKVKCDKKWNPREAQILQNTQIGYSTMESFLCTLKIYVRLDKKTTRHKLLSMKFSV